MSAPVGIEATGNAVTRWFGPRFLELHPLLQALHRTGGTLKGRVDITLGRGLAGWFGRRLAGALGVPIDAPTRELEVVIAHDGNALTWTRRFDETLVMTSVFRPVGTWPDGYWIEQTRRVGVRLTVDVIDGGWYWRGIGIRFGWLPLPTWLFPRSRAFKRIEGGRYFFCVEFALPLLGTALRYSGTLDTAARSAAA